MSDITNKYLQTIEDVSKGIIDRKKHSLKRFHSNLDSEIVKFIDSCSQAMFPLVFDNDECGNSEQIDFLRRSSFVSRIFLHLSNLLFYLGKRRDEAASLSERFLSKIPDIFEILETDAEMRGLIVIIDKRFSDCYSVNTHMCGAHRLDVVEIRHATIH